MVEAAWFLIFNNIMKENFFMSDLNRLEEAMANDFKGLYCCLDLCYELLDEASALEYYARFREYGIKIPKTTGYMMMDYCMFCGNKFPIDVRDEWYDILEHEYGLESPDEEDRKRVPKEFLTDEWWKKRGL